MLGHASEKRSSFRSMLKMEAYWACERKVQFFSLDAGACERKVLFFSLDAKK
jgi:hypothetical protein